MHIMTDGGCTPLTGDSAVHWVGVKTPSGTIARFVCPGVPRKQTDRMLLEYVAALEGDPPTGANQQTALGEGDYGWVEPSPGIGNGHWVVEDYLFDTGFVDCIITYEYYTHDIVIIDGLEYVKVVAASYDCHTIYAVKWRWVLYEDEEEEEEGPSEPPVTAVRINVYGVDTIGSGDTSNPYVGVVTYSDSTTANLGSYTWSSSNGAVLQSIGGGTFKAVGVGTATILASGAGVTGTKTIEVVPPCWNRRWFCKTDLTPTDTVRIYAAIVGRTKPLSQVDSAYRPMCLQIYNKLWSMLGAKQIFRGTTDEEWGGNHDANGTGDTFHVDPSRLNDSTEAGSKILAGLLFHEAAHKLYPQVDHGEPVGNHYLVEPFNHLDVIGPNKCVDN